MYERFIISPRSDYITHKCWLVVYDKAAEKYITEGKAYKRFPNSEEVYKWLKENYINNQSME